MSDRSLTLLAGAQTDQPGPRVSRKVRCTPRTRCTRLRSASATCTDFGRDHVRFTPHALMHIVGQVNASAVLLTGASMVLLDAWSGEQGLQVRRQP